jgi:integrase
LLLHTGQRRSDVVRMGPANVCEGVLTITQAKGRAGCPQCTLAIPLHPELVRALEDLPVNAPSFLITAYGKPMSAEGFSGWFTECANKAGLPSGCSPHGLRKAAARRLAEAGCSAHQIAAVTGHKSLREVERYTQSAQQGHLAREAMIKLWSASEPRGEV